jgi:hypothetical protein
MGKYRKFPFGYRMEFGEMVIDHYESRWVVYIFEQYILGKSFKSLSDTLCDAGIPYDADKPWNKNIVARILQDHRYTGEGKYPQIIETCIFQQVDEKRKKKVACSMVTKAQKMLKKKSGGRVTPQMEYEVLYLLNVLAGKSELIENPNAPNKSISKVETLLAELEEQLRMLPVDEMQARQKLMETTVAMYEVIDSREYETQRLKRIFAGEQMRSELDANLLDQCVSSVTVDSIGKVKIRLKNDQIIERRK